jgi:hypothetical protein
MLKRLLRRDDRLDPSLPRMRVPVVAEDRFAAIRNCRVLIYWPHGLGDWVHLAIVLPFLEPSNVYAITRIGDDYVSVMEGNAYVTPLYTGINALDDGSRWGARHFGVRYRGLDGSERELAIPPPLYQPMRRFAPDVVLWTDYPEPEGRSGFPFHTKARSLLRALVSAERLRTIDLARPIPSSLAFSVDERTRALVDERVRRLIPHGGRLCVLAHRGHTNPAKDWDPEEVRAFVRGLRALNARYRVVLLDGMPGEDSDLADVAVSYAHLFGDLDLPFARILTALYARADLFAGVPAGPLHLAMARGDLPVVGVWHAHHPDWYDEYHTRSVHLVGEGVTARGFDRRPSPRTIPPELRQRSVIVGRRQIPAELVLEAIRSLT